MTGPRSVSRSSDAAVLPFRQGRFEDLPEQPRLPHVYPGTLPLDVPLVVDARVGASWAEVH